MRATAQSDASNAACGANLKLLGKPYSAHKHFSPQEKRQSSTWRELHAILFSVQSFSPLLQGKTIFWETDNQAVPIIARKGSGKQHLQHMASNLYFLCKRHHITLDIAWISRVRQTAYPDTPQWGKTRRIQIGLLQAYSPQQTRTGIPVFPPMQPTSVSRGCISPAFNAQCPILYTTFIPTVCCASCIRGQTDPNQCSCNNFLLYFRTSLPTWNTIRSEYQTANSLPHSPVLHTPTDSFSPKHPPRPVPKCDPCLPSNHILPPRSKH